MKKHNVSQPKKEKLVKWYGWVIIFLLCMTPLVIVILPKLMLNVGRINKLLRESLIPKINNIKGEVLEVQWQKKVDGDIICIEGLMLIDTSDEGHLHTSFRKYVGPMYNETINISPRDHVELNGKYEENVFLIHSIINLGNTQLYDTNPLVSIY